MSEAVFLPLSSVRIASSYSVWKTIVSNAFRSSSALFFQPAFQPRSVGTSPVFHERPQCLRNSGMEIVMRRI